MQQLLDEWRKVYDYVLIDTSDISGLADVQSLASRVDQVLLVVSLMRVEREQLSDALQLLFRSLDFPREYPYDLLDILGKFESSRLE